jgi:hypothetical protein
MRTPNSDLFAASASSLSDILAVGQSTIHFDGTKTSANDIWAVGDFVNFTIHPQNVCQVELRF